MKKVTFLITFLIGNCSLGAQTQKAESLCNNVLAVSAAGQNGFGFITGSRYDKLFVVTAAHVVEAALEEHVTIDLKFFNDYKRYTGRVIRNYPDQDIALLEVSKPEYFKWSSTCLGQAEIGDDVGFIGRNGEWYIPRGRALGTINSIPRNQIKVDITSVTVGTSGAPLITQSGIVGMIVSTDDVEVRAIDLEQLRTTLAEEYDYFFELTAASKTTQNASSTENTSGRASTDQLPDNDGHQYSTKVLKDNKRWMTQNLNLRVDDSWCYDNDPTNCTKYGRLYTWEAAKAACAELGDGWRLPTDDEWREMAKKYGGADDDANDKGKAAYQALIGGGSGDFAAQLGGWRSRSGNFGNAGTYGYYWSSSPNGSSYAWHYGFGRSNGQLYRYYNYRDYGRSVRCLQDL